MPAFHFGEESSQNCKLDTMKGYPVVVICLFLPLFGTVLGECPGIYRRFQWNARPPTDIVNMTMPVSNVVVHHTVMGDGQCNNVPECIIVMKEIQDFHIDGNGWADIGYSFLIGSEGSIFEGRGWNRVGAHSPGYNDKSVGISLIGNFMEKLPPQVQINATQALIQCGIELGHIHPNYALFGHRDVRATDCPGNRFYDEVLSLWPNKQTTEPPRSYTEKMTA